MKYTQIQICEYGKPINHAWNKDEREAGIMASDKARVKYETGITIDLGGYQSARATVGIELPVENNVEDIDKAFEQAQAWAVDKLDDEVTHMFNMKKAMKEGKK